MFSGHRRRQDAGPPRPRLIHRQFVSKSWENSGNDSASILRRFDVMKNVIPAFLLAALIVTTGVNAQALLRVAGSTTVKGALEHATAELETACGEKIEFSGSGSNSGILSLLNGRTDIAMISTPLPEIADKLNEKTPGSVDLATLNVEPIGKARIMFIVNPKNPVRKLDANQLADVLTGRIRNWSELGGTDQAILVVSLASGSLSLQEKLTHGAALTPDARKVANAVQISPVVSLEAGAIGIISTAHVRGKTSFIETDVTVETPLFLVTRGTPTADQKKFIEAARQLVNSPR
jgi:phosphate transport system substrate-binding protein